MATAAQRIRGVSKQNYTGTEFSYGSSTMIFEGRLLS